jgi:hypothetical protein
MREAMHPITTANRRSTSRHTLSADHRLTKFQRLSWLALNLVNNAFARSRVDARLKEEKFRLSEQRLDELWGRIAGTASPSRRLCDLFWMSLPWGALTMEMRSIRALEMGCGTGVYGRLLQTLLKDCFERYVGVDIEASAQWSDVSDPRFVFEVGRAGDAHKFLAGANLIMTQSALEHFEEDLLYFEQVADNVRLRTDPVLQVHLVPSASCITTFPWHGIREYTPRTISKLTRLFGPETRALLFSLGGRSCNRVHRNFITWPTLRYRQDWRKTQNDAYLRALREALLSDFKSDDGTPAFYALVLVSHFKSDPFGGG